MCVHVRGVVTYILPIEAFVTRINNLDRLKVTLDLFPSKVLDHLNLQGFSVQNPCHTSLVTEKIC